MTLARKLFWIITPFLIIAVLLCVLFLKSVTNYFGYDDKFTGGELNKKVLIGKWTMNEKSFAKLKTLNGELFPSRESSYLILRDNSTCDIIIPKTQAGISVYEGSGTWSISKGMKYWLLDINTDEELKSYGFQFEIHIEKSTPTIQFYDGSTWEKN